MKDILVVDDNKDITGLFMTILESSGHKCTTANGGKEGLELLKRNNYDLILLDLAMPDMSGIDVLDNVKKDPVLKHKKILIITASSPTDSEIDRLKTKYEVLDVMKKPINKAKLLQMVEKY
jgi:CheY-like chemotaxis protein